MSAPQETEQFPTDLQAMIQAYLWCGVGGLALGIVAALLLVRFGPDFMQASPLFTVIALGLVFAIGVSMMGGLLHLTGSPSALPLDDGTASRDL